MSDRDTAPNPRAVPMPVGAKEGRATGSPDTIYCCISSWPTPCHGQSCPRARQSRKHPAGAFGPLIAAVIVALLAGGLRELRALLGQLLRWRVHPIWAVIALLGPFVLPAAAAALTVATGAPAPNLEAYTDWLAIGALLISTIIIVGLFEEVGWRGFALPRLQRRHDALWAALVLGVIWGPWHLPELISDSGQRPPLQFFVWVLAQSVILAWLYNSTNGSLPIVSFAMSPSTRRAGSCCRSSLARASRSCGGSWLGSTL